MATKPSCLLEKGNSQQISHKGYTYRVIEKGEGAPIVLIPGTAGDERIFCRIIEPLAKEFHVYSFSHIHAPTIQGVITEWKEILSSMINSPFHMLGTSVGGWIVQHFAASYPAMVKSIIIGNSYADNTKIRKKNKIPAFLARIMPMTFTRKIMLANMRKSLQKEPDFRIIYSYFEENLKKETKGQLLTRIRWNLENMALPKMPESIPKLLILSRDDPLIPPETRNQLIKTYPEAKIYQFSSGGHFPYITRAEKYYEQVRTFVQQIEKKEEETPKTK